MSLLAAQGQNVPYHADGKPCRIYSAAEFTALADGSTAFMVYRTTYYNMLKQWVNRTENTDDLLDITYGAQLPDDLAASMGAILGGDNA